MPERAEVEESFFRRSLADLAAYEPGKPVEEVQRELGLTRVVKLASNEGPFGPFPSARLALERSIDELNRYPDGGAYRLRVALAERYLPRDGAELQRVEDVARERRPPAHDLVARLENGL